MTRERDRLFTYIFEYHCFETLALLLKWDGIGVLPKFSTGQCIPTSRTHLLERARLLLYRVPQEQNKSPEQK